MSISHAGGHPHVPNFEGDEWTAEGKSATGGPESHSHANKNLGFPKTSADAGVDGSIWNAHEEVSATDTAGNKIGENARLDLDYASAGANASVGADLKGLHADAGASAEADAAKVTGDFTYDTPSVDVAGVGFHDHDEEKADARVGTEAHANADLTVGPSGFSGNADVGGSVGLRASASASDGIADAQGRTLFGVTAGVHGTAGAEADAHFDLGVQDGKIHLGIGLGAALGLGGGFDFSVDIDAGAIADDAWKMLKNDAPGVAAAIEGAADEAKEIASDVGEGLKDAAEWTEHAVSDAATAVGDAATAVGHAVGEAATAVGHAVSDAASAVGHAVTTAASAVGHAVTGAVSAVGNALGSAAHTIASWFGF
jgi:hypothetical protein